MRFLILDRSVGLKRKKHKQNHENRRPWYPRMTLKVNIYDIFGLKKSVQYTLKNVPVSGRVFLYAVTKLIFQFKTIISSEKWFNYVVTCFWFCFCFFENTKNLGRLDYA